MEVDVNATLFSFFSLDNTKELGVCGFFFLKAGVGASF